MRTDASERFAEAREADGPFASIGDLARRVNLAELKRQGVESLARAGAFDSLEPNRRRLALSAEDLVRYSQSFHAAPTTGLASLFGEEDLEVCDPVLVETHDYDAVARFEEERDAAGFLISGHPLDAHRQELDRHGIGLASEVGPEDETGRCQVAAMITNVVNQVSRNTGKPFARITLTDPKGSSTVLMFERELNRCRAALQEQALVILQLEVVHRDGRDGLVICRDLRKLGASNKPRVAAAPARDEGLRIRIASAEAAGGVSETLNRNGATNGSGTRYRVRLALRLSDLGAWAEIQLPGRFRLSTEAQEALQKESGVLSLETYAPPPMD